MKDKLLKSAKRKLFADDDVESKAIKKEAKPKKESSKIVYMRTDKEWDQRIGIVYGNEGGSEFFKLQKIFRENENYLSPSKTTHDTPSPRKLLSNTPSKTEFVRMAKITIEKNDEIFPFYIYQKKKEVKRYDRNEENKSKLEQMKDRLSPPPSNTKEIEERLVTSKSLENAKKHKRKPTKSAYNGISGNEMSLLCSPIKRDRGNYEISHLIARSHGGDEDEDNIYQFARITTIGTADFNSTRLTLVENPATIEIKKGKELFYHAISELIKDSKGNPTHFGGKETSTWSSLDKKTKITVELDSQNPQKPIRSLVDFMVSIYDHLFDDEPSKEETSALTC